MEVLSDKMRAAQDYVAHQGPDQRRATVKSLDSTWRNHTGKPALMLSLPVLQQMVAKVAIEDVTGTPSDFGGVPLSPKQFSSASRPPEYVMMGGLR